ncbi:MAG: MinD/ParA family protein [Gammaproteobacteria bacterium]|nr:MinD/ParA family protein [Gammaproteobacteria bacterium]
MDAPELVAGQAAGLEGFGERRPVRVIAVTGAKGGVGKTNVSVNLAVAMARAGKRVMLMDADLGLANVDVLLGLQVRRNLSHVMDGECTLEEIMVEGPAGVQILPAASGVKRMVSLSTLEHAGLINAFSTLPAVPDVFIVDTAAGISDSVIRFTVAAQDVLVVVCDEPASITDAYALIKVLNRDHGQDHFHILANMVRSNQEGLQLFQKLVRVTERFLDVTLDFAGSVPYDDNLRRAVQKQLAVMEAFPRSPAAKAFEQVAGTVERWRRPQRSQGHLEFFVERLVQSGGF